MQLRKPKRLSLGDTIAVVTPSWGGPGLFPDRYQAGKRQLEETFGVSVVEMPHTLSSPEFVQAHPDLRAQDLMAAFADPEIDGIIAAIGGDDCIRLLPHLDLDIIRDNPKVFLGFSDTTALHFACLTAGLGSFYGPSIMAGFAENGGMHDYTVDAVRKALFSTDPIRTVPVNHEGWTCERVEWAEPALQSRRRQLQPGSAPRMLQGEGIARGHLIGGCAEVLEMVKGTAWWPGLDHWRGAILFYETSEDAPPAKLIRYALRNLAAQGILGVLSGILLARPDPADDPDYERTLEAAFSDILEEAGLASMPVLSGLDFGHTQPMLTLPYGAQAEIDCRRASLTILDAGTVE